MGEMITAARDMRRLPLSDYGEEWRCRTDNGRTYIRCYTVYPGIVLKQNCMHVPAIGIPQDPNYSCLKLNCCVNGRCEVPIAGSHYVYLEPGRVNFDLRQPERGCIFR